MESNTFATSAYIAAPPATVHEYLRHLKNLDEWTLGSRMVEQVDDSTWIGTASGYQHNLYYHLRSLESPRFRGIEWQCGYEYRNYFKSYPVLLFPAEYVGSNEPGTYLHWISVIDPAQRTPMIMQGIQTVHNSEVRALKAALEREAGLTQAAPGRHRIEADTIYIDAPLEMAADFLGDLRTIPRWSHLLKPEGALERERGSFLDEYRQTVDVTLRTHRLEDYVLVEQDYHHPRFGTLQRSPTLLIPLAHAFGDPAIAGVILHRITFWNDAAPACHGKLGIEDFGAENMNIKRLLEAKAGNLESFARGQSYISQPRAPEQARRRMTPPDIFAADFIGDPYPAYRRMRDQHPLYHHAGSNAYILSRYDDVRAALTDPRFTTRSYAAQIEPLLGVTLVQRDGQDHARERRLLAAPFRPDRFQPAFASAIQHVADDLIARFVEHDEVELIGAFITPFAVGVLAAVIGLPRSDIDRFRTWYTALLRFGMNLVGDPAVTQAGLDARNQLNAYLRPLVAACRHAPEPGLLSLLSTDPNGLTDDEIVRAAMLLVFAGGETVEKTLAAFLRNLLAHPEQLARVSADRALIDRALAESLRYTAPTHMVPRRTREPATVSGGVIPAEAEVICFLAAANRDERHFARPDIFDIDRPGLDGVRAFTAAADHAAFGMGRHFCLGAIMAKTEIHIATNRLLDALPGIRFAAAAPPDHGLFLRGPLRLDVCVRTERSALCC